MFCYSFKHKTSSVLGSVLKKDLTNSMSSGLAAVVKQRHVSQTVAVVHVATTLQDLKHKTQKTVSAEGLWTTGPA